MTVEVLWTRPARPTEAAERDAAPPSLAVETLRRVLRWAVQAGRLAR